MRTRLRGARPRSLLLLLAVGGAGFASVPALAHRGPSVHRAAGSGLPRWLAPLRDGRSSWLGLLRGSASEMMRASRGRATSIEALPVTVHGTLTVAFSGTAPGCARLDACGETGTLTWHPARSGELLSVIVGGSRHPRYEDASFVLGSSSSPSSGVTGTTRAQTTDPGGAACADATRPGDIIPVGLKHGTATVAFDGAEPSVVTTRCGAPLARDIGEALGTVRLPAAALLAGRRTIAFPAGATFTGGGFTGTVTSSIRFTLGRRQVARVPSGSSSSHALRHPGRVRYVDVLYRARLAGTVGLTVHGDATSALCQPLDACGYSGTTTIVPDPAATLASWATVVSRHASERVALRALGEVPGRARPRSIEIGEAMWAHGGTARARVSRSAGMCADRAGIGSVELVFGRLRNAFGVALLGDGSLGESIGLGRTRCPGPFDHHVLLAEGFVPISDLERRRVTVEMNLGGGYFGDDGWHGTARPRLRLTLVRERISERLVSTTTALELLVG